MTFHVAPRQVSRGPVSQGQISPAGGLDDVLRAHRAKDVLRFITCGSVDDGKSTLIGRLLHDTKQLLDDQLAALKRDSRRHGTQGGAIDFALLVDGLSAEREQGITIDVAYRFFSTERRTFIVADAPGHEQYTRNMATGASTADLAVLLVDARKGLSRQTRRHSLLLSMLGIRQVVLAVNKMDLVGWSQDRFDAIMAEYLAFAEELGFASVIGVPLSALSGDNVVESAVAAPWYRGPTLLRLLERAPAGAAPGAGPFRLPVQWVNRPDSSFRGYAGLIAAGHVAVGDRVRVASGAGTSVARIVTFDGDLSRAVAGQSVTIVLADEVDISRGDVIAAAAAPPQVGAAIEARLFWSGNRPLQPGDTFHVKLATASAMARIEAVRHRIDPDSAVPERAASLAPNDIADVTLTFDRTLAFDPYGTSRETGSFILIDRESLDTVGIGLVLGRVDDGEGRAGRRLRDLLPGVAPVRRFIVKALASFAASTAILFTASAALAQAQLLNVSYDPTRELYRAINAAFAEEWKAKTGETVTVRTSHGGSGKQARSVIDGLSADVVTLALAGDIDEIARATRKIPQDWQKRLLGNAAPYTSTIVFLTRKGNPKGIRDWDDLAKGGVQVITPNPKTSGGARWSYLAAWGYALDKWKDEGKAREFVAAVFKNVPVLDTGARGATVTFAQRGLGDVLIAWENEAFLAFEEFGKDKFEIVVPSISILAEPPVALVDGNVDAKGTRKAAQAYLEFLYTPKAQGIIAKHHYRPRDSEAADAKDIERLPKLRLFTIDAVFGGWGKAQSTHFADGGEFDRLMKASR
jgi:sulfate adenylyltransferase subunit 1